MINSLPLLYCFLIIYGQTMLSDKTDEQSTQLFHLLKRKSLKITNSHRHITKSKHQLCIPMQTHDTPLLPLKNTTRNTYLLLFLNILFKRLIHQFNVIRHGFIQINKFFHLSMGNNSHAIGIAVFCKILPGEQMGKDEIQFIQRGTYKQITITVIPFHPSKRSTSVQSLSQTPPLQQRQTPDGPHILPCYKDTVQNVFYDQQRYMKTL